MARRLTSVVLAGGGTGGHVYPLLAFADCLRRHDPGIRITCLGSPRGLENELIPPHGYDLRIIPAHQLPRSLNVDLLLTPGRMWRAARAAGRILDEVAADVVVGFGGYVAAPAYLAAWRRELPTVVHEVNVPPGISNRLGALLTPHVAVGFAHQRTAARSLRRARVVGLPLRRAIATLDRAERRDEARARFGLLPDAPVLLVSGGSGGARTLNVAAAGAAKALSSAGIQVLHIIGARNEEVTVPPDLPLPYVTLRYLDQMELAYAAADLMLGRGGAMTVAELTAVGLPAVYVPYPYSNQEQRRNARPVVAAGGGLLVDNDELNSDWIEQHLIPLLHDRPRLAAMSAAAARFGHRDGDEMLREFVLEVVPR
ncbi:MAG TPA: undecaprenyldiphospho-muramoylpentapeptide beta-N-acetylglucosaminyltransferase [Natronosporangium sp.]|nr:undecaprenyldiphospho-muramoylpentapeptide beta-N-acetylglucosaminyltransferase [Natronosporangium sp.]